jgi:hypothetical protein
VAVGVPSGTVSFLFTDMEGSTRRWEEDPDAMRLAVARHDQVVRGAIQAHRATSLPPAGTASPPPSGEPPTRWRRPRRHRRRWPKLTKPVTGPGLSARIRTNCTFPSSLVLRCLVDSHQQQMETLAILTVDRPSMVTHSPI